MSAQESEQLGGAIADAIHAPSGAKSAKLTEIVKVVDSNGNETGQTKPRFILKPSAYLDIKAYIAAGLAFPASTEDFQTLHPKENLTKLVDLDATIYEKTELAMVGVHKSCYEFNTKALPNFRLITNEAKQFANTAIMALVGFEEGSFQGMLKILTDDKYESVGSEDTKEFRGAKEAASTILQDLGEQSLKKAQVIQGLVDNVTSFLTVLKKDKDEIEAVTQKYDGEKGYSTILSTGLETIRNEIKTAVAEADAAHKEWESDKATADNAVAYIWIPVAGWIAGTSVMVTYNNRATAALNKYNDELKLKDQKEKEMGYMERLIADVGLLTHQNTQISALMEKAKEALQDIQQVFEQIGLDLKDAAGLMGTVDTLLSRSLFVRQKAINGRVNEAVKDWRNVVAAADDFLKAEATFVGITDSVTAPQIS